MLHFVCERKEQVHKRRRMEKRSRNERHVDVVLDWLQNLRHDQVNRRIADEGDFAWGNVQQLNYATWLLGGFQVFLIILFATVAGSEVDYSSTPGSVTQGYDMFVGVEVMMFVGFGYLMTFLKWYGLGAVGLTMLVTAMGLQWSLFTESLFAQTMSTNSWHYVDVNIYSLLNALYAISAVLISFGAVIGKITPFQLTLMTIVELVFHSINFKVLMDGCLHFTDLGGTYIDHMFGAYFGLAVALMLGKPEVEPEMGNTPDIFSLIGTVFLWVYWPSFVAGAAVADSDQQGRAIVSTVLALSASTVAAFLASSLLSKDRHFRPVDIQNATLAGGVAIGCTANLASPFDAIMIGIAAGFISTLGYHHIQPYLQERGLHDTCGVHNLHAMPSLVGALASVILAGYKESAGHDSALYGPLAYHGAW
jgi:ammonium transporter Rh